MQIVRDCGLSIVFRPFPPHKNIFLQRQKPVTQEQIAWHVVVGTCGGASTNSSPIIINFIFIFGPQEDRLATIQKKLAQERIVWHVLQVIFLEVADTALFFVIFSDTKKHKIGTLWLVGRVPYKNLNACL